MRTTTPAIDTRPLFFARPSVSLRMRKIRPGDEATVWLAMADMELSERIQQLQQLDEMKNDTAITRRIKDVLRILSEDATKKTNLERLLENIRRSIDTLTRRGMGNFNYSSIHLYYVTSRALSSKSETRAEHNGS